MQCAEYFSFHIYQYDFYFVVFLPRFIIYNYYLIYAHAKGYANCVRVFVMHN